MGMFTLLTDLHFTKVEEVRFLAIKINGKQTIIKKAAFCIQAS